MDALKNIVWTANGAFAYPSSGSACLDAFSGLNAYTGHVEYDSILRNSWAEDPLKTLRLIWHLRSIHEGQSANEPFYRAFAWLYHNHTRTAILNLPELVAPVIEKPTDGDIPRRRTHGYYKDLLNILVLATNDELTTTAKHDSLRTPRVPPKGRPRVERRFPPETRDARVQAGLEHNQKVARAARQARDAARRERALNVERRLAADPAYKALFVSVARIFADGIAHDLQSLRAIADPLTSDDDRIRLSISLTPAAKWAPSINGTHDRHTNIVTAIAELLYARGELVAPSPPLPAPLAQEDAHRVRGMYTRWAVSPLRRFMQVTETLMSARQWAKIRYGRVPSKCMALNAKHFHKHDEARFGQYLLDVAQGARTISGATLAPHELLAAAAAPLQDVERRVVEAQWNAMVQGVRDSGALDNCLAVCDVSGSMGHYALQKPTTLQMAREMRERREKALRHVQPIVPALALSLVLAQTAREPWRNCFITFSQAPQVVRLNPSEGLAQTARQIAKGPMGFNTDFNAVFMKAILPTALRHRLKPEDMIKRLFVFSDMEFDAADPAGSRWATEHEIIKAQFAAAGYPMPELVYWNLQGGRMPRPVKKDETGTALVTGFSPNMLKLFMSGEELAVDEVETSVQTSQPDGTADVAQLERRPPKTRMDPMAVMDKALNRPSFAGLRVLD